MLKQIHHVFLLLILLASTGWGTEKIELIVDGKPGISIWLQEDASPPEKTAAKWLAEYLKKSSGLEFQIQTFKKLDDVALPAIILKANTKNRDCDGFSWKIDVNGIQITGNNGPSVIYGVCSFLEKHLGIRWLAPGDLWTVVPKNTTISLPYSSHCEEAGFPFRVIHITGVYQRDDKKYAHWNFDIADWMARNGINYKKEHVGRYQLLPLMEERGIEPYRAGHGLASWMPNKIFFDTHPEYYAYDGFNWRKIARASTQLNYSSPEMCQAFAERVLEYLEKHPETKKLGLSLNDGYGFSCDPISKKDWRFNNEGTLIVSDSIFGFMNRVATIVCNKYPNILLEQLAYTPYYHQAPSFKLHPNVAIDFKMYRKGCVTPMSEGSNAQNRKMRDELEEWCENASPKHIIIGEYIAYYQKDNLFAGGVRMIAEDIAWYHQKKLEGVVTEYPGTNDYKMPAREMLYVYTKKLWNPERDYMNIIEDFYATAYGTAKEPMLKAYHEYQNAMDAAKNSTVNQGQMAAWSLLQTPGFKDKMLTYLHEALNKTNDQKAIERIRQVKAELIDFLADGEPLMKYQYCMDEPELDKTTIYDTVNVASNPGFEKKSFSEWSFNACEGAPSSNEAWEGKHSLALCFNTNGESDLKLKRGATITVPVEKDEFYKIQIMARPDQDALNTLSIMYMIVSGTDRNKDKIGPALFNRNWSPMYFGIHKANSDKLTIKLWLVSGRGVWYFDGLRIEKLKNKD